MSILVHGPMGKALEKYGPILDPNGVVHGLLQYGVQCGQIGRGTLHIAD